MRERRLAMRLLFIDGIKRIPKGNNLSETSFEPAVLVAVGSVTALCLPQTNRVTGESQRYTHYER